MAAARVYLGRLPADVQKQDIEDLFKDYTRRLLDIKLMGTFGFCEFEDPRDAEDVVKKFNGELVLGEKILVEHAKGLKPRRDPYGPPPGYGGDSYGPGAYGRPAPRVRRGTYRVVISNLPPRTSWQDLKDLGREAGRITFADVDPIRPDEGILEYESREDMERALDKIEGVDLRGNKLRADPAPARAPSPPPRGRYGGGYDDYPPYPPPGGSRGGWGNGGGRGGYDRGGDRRPPPRDPYDDDRRPPPRDPYDDDRRAPPPPRDGYDDDRARYSPRASKRAYDDEAPSAPPARASRTHDDRVRDRSRSPAPRRSDRE